MKTPKPNSEKKVVEKLIFLSLGKKHDSADLLYYFDHILRFRCLNGFPPKASES